MSIFDFSRHLKDKNPMKLLKSFGINEDFDKINIQYFTTKRQDYIKELLEKEKTIQKANENADRIMALDKGGA